MSYFVALLLLPLAVFALGFWFIRWTERRDWKAAQDEIRTMRQMTRLPPRPPTEKPQKEKYK